MISSSDVTKFQVFEIKLYVTTLILSTKNKTKLLGQLKTGLKDLLTETSTKFNLNTKIIL